MTVTNYRGVSLAVDAVAGVALERQTDDRRGYENFTGSGSDRVLGVTGNQRVQVALGQQTLICLAGQPDR